MTSKNTIYITLVFLLLLTILLIVFVIFPLFKGITKNAADFMKAKEKVAALDAEIGNMEILKNQYQGYQPDLEKINLLFADAEVPIEFIRFLEKLALDSNVFVIISPASSLRSGDAGWQSFSFRLAASGSFLDFSRFLEKLENAPYLIEVQNLSIKAIEPEGEEQIKNKKVEADLNIKVFAK